jgi:hypothetical protein
MKSILLTLALLLFTSVSEARVYGNLDPCISVDEKVTCLASATQEEVQQWHDYHLNTSVLDEGEKKALALYKLTAFSDVTSTVTGLVVCAAVVEANPLGLLIPLGKYLHYKKLEKEAKRTSRYHSMATGITLASIPGGAATLWNIGEISKCF